MRKGEIACYKQFLLLPQCFQKACFPGVSKGVIVWEWVNPLPQNKILETCDPSHKKRDLMGIAKVSTLVSLRSLTTFEAFRNWQIFCVLTHYHTILHFHALKIYIAVENIVRKGEIAWNKQFLFLSQCFLPYVTLIFHLKCTLKSQ